MKKIQLPTGENVPAFGMGTWNMGDEPSARREELATLQLGLDLGARLIDTAEMYGSGHSEELVGEAVGTRRDEVFLVTKVLPENASRAKAIDACHRSLRRLKTDRIDLYLLHWRGTIPLEETIDAFAELQKAGKIRHFGVSNLDLANMEELWRVPGGASVAANQLLYNLSRRKIEWDLLPWLRERHIPVMAYSPIEQARLLNNTKLRDLAVNWGMTAAQAALAWLLEQKDIIVIPKTSGRRHLKENFDALTFHLTPVQLAAFDELFPPPKGPASLDML
jgi:diketogulonate reductase-like aldo/keto reductase